MPLENENENEDINKDRNRNKEEEKETYNNFRKEFPGTKRGNDSEFYNFVKKHKDWKESFTFTAFKIKLPERSKNGEGEKVNY